MNGNKKFSITVNPIFPNKIKSIRSNLIRKDEKLPGTEKEAAEVCNELFVNTAPNLNINVHSK